MIHTKVYYQGGRIAGFHVEGHSPKEWGNKGENLLCAGVSTLVQSAHSYLSWQKALEKEKKEDGDLEFLISSEKQENYQNLLQMVEFGLKALSSQYPDAIRIQEEIIKR
ncbi:ribosomal-processing cysteine protease Prp [Leptospira idonii]|uniref:Ribosomal processing cysteine protease Prp n=1 Tax=Leptospira idonii TaxID=1193500 RepID=A0A4R9LY52_9LEPT|nr:ribosomal-processing cysteine protease Prp [Leptospira idonii]TGN18632.1 ribosomal-processing cysteine protease Prp [Leptospira idonii]